MKLIILFIMLFGQDIQIPETYLYTDTKTAEGYLSGYADGVMEESIAYYDNLNYSTWCGFECRQDLDGYVVVAHCNRIGSKATLSSGGQTFRVMVADCIAQEHIVDGNIFDRGYILEADYELFQLLPVRYGRLVYD